MKVVYVVNNPDFLISHRLGICLKMQSEGKQVHIVCPKMPSVSQLIDLGFKVHLLDFGRNRSNPFVELITLFHLVVLFKRIRPELVHLITIKPYLYGGIAARITGVKGVVSAVAGLGILFSSGKLKYRALRFLLLPLFKAAFRHKNQIVIFQNASDCTVLVNSGIVANYKVRMIRGSGVDLSTCSVLDEPDGVPIISLASRLLKDKGVEVFVDASRILKQRNVDARFWLIGMPDLGNANSVTQSQLNEWEREGLVELLGFRNDVSRLFSLSSIVTLPSFYGEGLPKVLIEASACGRAVITTDHPGCRDAIEVDLTGVLIPVRDAEALANAIQDLIENPEKRKEMGQAGRELAEKEFAIEKVVDAHFKIYNELLAKVAK